MAWSAGQKLYGERYIIERQLGEGGLGITYLAKDRRGNRAVIKTLKDEVLTNPNLNWFRERFQNEALQLSLCGHRHIVRIDNAFREGELFCIAMEYIDGIDLRHRVSLGGVLSEEEALLYIRQIGEALSLVHEKGLLHRDVKPANIMLRCNPSEAVLIDFGLARGFIRDRTQYHTIGYSDGFAPPEQYVRKARLAEYTDVYALAATLYYVLTKIPPTPADWREWENAPLTPPKEINSNLSERVNHAILTGMELEVENRPQSVRDWLDLLPAVSQEEISQRVFIEGEPPDSRSGEGEKSDDGAEATELSLPPALSATIPEVPVRPNGNLPPAAAAGAVSQTWECVHTLTGHSNWVTSVAISPDGQILASGSADKTIKLWQLNTGREICTLTGHAGFVYSVAISPDGQTLASGSRDRTIKLWQLSTGREIRTCTGHSSTVYSVAISPCGPTLASGSRDRTIRLWKLSEGGEIYTLRGHFNDVRSVAISPDGQTLASGSYDKTIKLWQLSTGKEIRTLTGHSFPVDSIAFSPDGRILASGSSDMTVKLWQISTGEEIRTFTCDWRTIWSVAISPDGQTLASRSNGNNIGLWELNTGAEISTLSGHSRTILSVAFSSDGRTLVSGSDDATVKIWRRVPS